MPGPAAMFVQAAAKQPVKVMTIAKAGGDLIDARSILSVLALDPRRAAGTRSCWPRTATAPTRPLTSWPPWSPGDLDSEG